MVATSNAQDAVQGVSSAQPHAGVSGTNTGGGFGLWAASDAAGGTGIYARGKGNAAWFDGNVQVNGTITVQADIVLANADCAEEFDAAGLAAPGTVMVIGDDEALRPSAEPYDRRVAGVVSGGGQYKPALLLDRRASSRPRSAVALVGKVCCKVDAEHGPVKVGDLLTTSPTPGHAMRASDRDRAFGAVIGKALQPLESGQALIPILVALQ
jgi:prepilin-type processing-associated H-X9-DG protein